MRETFTNNSIDFITKYYTYEGKNYDRLKYGLEGLYSLITKTVVLLLLALVFGIFKETLILICLSTVVRMFSFGIHASKSIYCWITTIPIYLIGAFVSTNITINLYIKIIVAITSFVIFALYAPADTPKKPLINSYKRKRAKIISLIIVTMYICLIFFNISSLYTNCLILTLVFQAVCIHPFTYKIFKIPFNNYKSYIKEV